MHRPRGPKRPQEREPVRQGDPEATPTVLDPSPVGGLLVLEVDVEVEAEVEVEVEAQVERRWAISGISTSR